MPQSERPSRRQRASILRCQDEVIFVQPVNDVRKKGDAKLSPSDEHVRVMPLLLGDFRDCVGKLHGLAEVLERELALEMMTIHRSPARFQFRHQPFLLPGIKGRNPSPARDAPPAGKVAVLCSLFEYSDFRPFLTLPRP